jgi:hypothetical protein
MGTLTTPVWAVTREKIEEAVRRLVEAAQPRRIILFGSRARETPALIATWISSS